ncbi:hypothetical protein [Streptomyces sp. CBMA123]|uniref:hypothetical protein n=1 Tax=Streptomyces sp. CBMA123 TaxID=1896313 RepID=UPI0016619B80|nr:hypothetical protein [Streptomyces sp. CBMA123]MBD0693250.1 hypothetical protein [Streptomyces sp. CBMA123]
MKRWQAALAGTVVSLGITLTSAQTADAVSVRQPDFVQAWHGSASYRASKDFVPQSNLIQISTLSCAGKAPVRSKTQLVRTRDKKVIYSGNYYNATGSWVTNPDWIQVNPGEAYYLRWYSQFGPLVTSRCQGVLATG